MCGIWASIGGDFKPEQVLKAVRRRGPDGEGWLEEKTPLGMLRLGHRRLSIYDPTPASDQPMTSADGRLTIVFNGAIYNHRALRTELEATGAAFRTSGDTEVILAAYAHWGENCLARFDGMFAFALFDRTAMKLLLARDRFGEKPLLLANDFANGALLATASDLHQMRDAGARPWSLQADVAADFLNIGMSDASTDTFVQAVKKAPAGSYSVVNLSEPASPRRALDPSAWRAFANFPPPDPSIRGPAQAAEALYAALARSVSSRLAADVEVGSCLSGGLDSTGVVALTAPHLSGRTLKCFAAVFDEIAPDGSSLSERPYVNAAIEALPHADVHILTPTGADCATHIDDIVAAQGEPFAHTSICAQWFVLRAAREANVKVMLDGQGADELFGGYSGMIGPRLADLIAAGRFDDWRITVAELSEFGGESTQFWRRATINAYLDERLRRRISGLRGKWPPSSFPAPGHLPPLAPGRSGSGGISRFDAVVRDLVSARSLPGLLRYEDRNAMWHGVETRLPYLSREVVDLAMRYPGALKLRDGRTKDVLRRAFSPIVPEAITNRRTKLGFVSPHDAWMAGPLKGWARAHTESAASKWSGLVDPARARASSAAIDLNNQQANTTAFRIACFSAWTDSMALNS